jgi:CDP-diacylglycerol--glycerol-3-phosphate 3-phosphatidyltransferase
MRDVHGDIRPRGEPDRLRALRRADREQIVHGEHVAATGLPACDPVEFAQLLQRVDADVRVGTDAEPDPAMKQPLDRQEAVAEVRLCGRTSTDARAGGPEQVELPAVGMGRVDDSRAWSEAAAGVEELDRPHPVLGEALLDLARLLVGVHVQHQLVFGGVAPQLLEPVTGAGTDGVGGDADADPGGAQLLELAQVPRHRLLPEAVETAARVGDVEQDELDSGLLGRRRRRTPFLEPEVVELAHRGVARAEQLAIDVHVIPPHALWGLTPRELEHRLAPGPEIAALGPASEGALEGVAMGVDETGDPHTPILPQMEARAVPLPLAQLPNALTVARLALIPVFVVLMVRAGQRPSWPAGVTFGIAGITDQVDGFLARRWRVESRFGRFADPLADRLMIDAAVILLFAYDRLPWAGLAVILGRDVVLLAGSVFLAPRGVEIDVNLFGKAATWVLYAAIFFRIVTHRSTNWPLDLFWAGIALALLAGTVYARTAWERLRR